MAKTADGWRPALTRPFKLDYSSTEALRSSLRAHAVPLAGAVAVLSSSIAGIAYQSLDRMGFAVFEASSCQDSVLDGIIADIEAAKADAAGDPAPGVILDAGGACFVDLIEAQAANPEKSSKSILGPYLKSAFTKIEVACNHVPAWIANQAEALGIHLEAEDADDGTVRLTITKRP
jgi:hypothetical protein